MNPTCSACGSLSIFTVTSYRGIFSRRRLVTVVCPICGHEDVTHERRKGSAWLEVRR